MESKNEPLVVEKQLEASVETVWEAITETNKMKEWFFEQIENFEPVVGFETNFVVKSGDRIFSHLWKITQVIHEHKIVYNWKYDGYVGDSFVTFQLKPLNSGTHIRVITSIVEDFIDDIPEFQPESCITGWEYFLERLNLYLQK